MYLEGGITETLSWAEGAIIIDFRCFAASGEGMHTLACLYYTFFPFHSIVDLRLHTMDIFFDSCKYFIGVNDVNCLNLCIKCA